VSQDRSSIIAAFLLTPRGRQLREPGARRLACARHCPGITAGEIARGIEIAAKTVRAEAAAQQGGTGGSHTSAERQKTA
jgi:hypothetical protein